MILEQESVHWRSDGVGKYAAAVQDETMFFAKDMIPRDEKAVAALTIFCFLEHVLHQLHADCTS